MTREELIDGLYDVKNWHCNGDERLHTLVTEAIQALEQEPCEDCISRQAVLEQIDQWAIGNREYLPTNAMHYLTERMQDLPPVTPQYTEAEIQKMQEVEQAEIEKAYELGKEEQLKTGHWIVDSATSSQIGIHGKKTFNYDVHCDKCRWKWAYTTDKKDSIPSNYCPNCGAKMVKP